MSPGWDVSEEDLAKLREELRRTLAQPPRLLTPLPRRTLLRLRVNLAIDNIGIWLAYHGRYRAAERWWRITRRWKPPARDRTRAPNRRGTVP